MNKQDRARLLAFSTAAVAGLLLGAPVASAAGISADGFPASVPKATCGAGDHTESGLQGETTVQERFSGDSERAYNCNLELVGIEPQDVYQGGYSQDGPAYDGDCAYYGTDRAATLQGIKVIDASDPAHPVVTAHLTDTPAALSPHETVTTSEKTHILVAAQSGGANVAVYDTSDCRHPVLKSSIQLSNDSGHMAFMSPDGKTYYLSDNRNLTSGPGGFLHVVDVSDPSNARELMDTVFPGVVGAAHSFNVNPQGFSPGLAEGTRLYVGQFGEYPYIRPDGLVIQDISDYQYRRPNPQARTISTLFWTDSGGGESMIPIKIKGHPYLVSTDEAGGAGGAGGWDVACARGASAFGYPQIIDVADELHPKIVAKLRLEVSDPANCAALRAETPPDAPGTAPGTNLPAISGTTNYSEETCVPDNVDNTKMLACGFQNAALRVFDVRDPAHAREIAYYKPGAVRTRILPASGSWAAGSDRTVDKIAHWVRWVQPGKGRGALNGGGNGNSSGPAELQLWTVSDGHGFQVLRFTENFKSKNADLVNGN